MLVTGEFPLKEQRKDLPAILLLAAPQPGVGGVKASNRGWVC